MKGTEKQIAWATDIQAAAVKAIDTLIATTKADPRYAANRAAIDRNIAVWEARRAAIESVEYAGDLIEVYRSVRADASDMANIKAMMSAIKVTVPNTPAQKALLQK